MTGEWSRARSRRRRSLVPRVADRDFRRTDRRRRASQVARTARRGAPDGGDDASRHARARRSRRRSRRAPARGESLSAMFPPICASVRYPASSAPARSRTRVALPTIRARDGSVKVKVGAASARRAWRRSARSSARRPAARRREPGVDARRGAPRSTPSRRSSSRRSRIRCANAIPRARPVRDDPVALVLDEPVASLADLRRYATAGACDVVNARLRAAGSAPSLAMCARRHGVRVQVGCHVGETAISRPPDAFAAALPTFAVEIVRDVAVSRDVP